MRAVVVRCRARKRHDERAWSRGGEAFHRLTVYVLTSLFPARRREPQGRKIGVRWLSRTRHCCPHVVGQQQQVLPTQLRRKVMMHLRRKEKRIR